MKYIAVFLDGQDLYTREMESRNKAQLKDDLRRNGYKVRGIWTPEQYAERLSFLDAAGAEGAKNITHTKYWKN